MCCYPLQSWTLHSFCSTQYKYQVFYLVILDNLVMTNLSKSYFLFQVLSVNGFGGTGKAKEQNYRNKLSNLWRIITDLIKADCKHQQFPDKSLLYTHVYFSLHTWHSCFFLQLSISMSYFPHLSLKIMVFKKPNFISDMNFSEKYLYNTFVWCFFINNIANIFIYGFFDKHFSAELRNMFALFFSLRDIRNFFLPCKFHHLTRKIIFKKIVWFS
jgi:hypothetical protein